MTFEEKMLDFRKFRKEQFAALDEYKKRVAYGLIEESDMQRIDVFIWYEKMLNFTRVMNEQNYKQLKYPVTPSYVAQFLDK